MSQDSLDHRISDALSAVARSVAVPETEFDLSPVVDSPQHRRPDFTWSPVATAVTSFVVVVALVGGALFVLRGDTPGPSELPTPPAATSSSTSPTRSTSPPSEPTESTTTTSVPEGQTSTSTATTAAPGVAPSWPGPPPAEYLVISDDRIDWWLSDSLVETVWVSDVDNAVLMGDKVVFDTESTSDVYVFPEVPESEAASPGGSGSVLFSHHFETQIRLHDVAVVDGEWVAVVEEIDEFNFGDELEPGDQVPERRLMLYRSGPSGKTLLLDIPQRRPELEREIRNGSVTAVSVAGGTVAVSFRTNERGWIELFDLTGGPIQSALPYQLPSAQTMDMVGGLSPDSSMIAVGVDDRIELWKTSGERVGDWVVAPEGQHVSQLAFDGTVVAGALSWADTNTESGSFAVDVNNGAIVVSDIPMRVTFGVVLPNG